LIEFYKDARSAQSDGENLGTSIVIMTIMPLDCHGVIKLKIAADKNIWGSPFLLVMNLGDRVERYLEYLPVHRVSTTDIFSFKGEGHILSERKVKGRRAFAASRLNDGLDEAATRRNAIPTIRSKIKI